MEKINCNFFLFFWNKRIFTYLCSYKFGIVLVTIKITSLPGELSGSILGGRFLFKSLSFSLLRVEVRDAAGFGLKNLGKLYAKGDNFMFQLTYQEVENLRSQIVTSSLTSAYETFNNCGGRRYLPFVFTEQGVFMLSAVLKSPTAVKVCITIMDGVRFVA
ncbi:ORF6N domain-containing protein [uncultured Alistipes sp.]|uniref:ORF6N domain-containing protein n=2 Tax=uncultured Alistipes sp. TaxID=538949 RepID=UPI0026F3E362|nr:ORF6N domain-containing protein [uncultured Alistipes sp.]